MNDRRRGLGRGLGSLIPTAPPAPAGPAAGESWDTSRPEAAPEADGSQPRAEAPAASASPSASPTVQPWPVAGAWFAEIPLDRVVQNPRQPRQVFEEEALAELVTSLKEVGLLQPVVVREVTGEGAGGDGPRFELIMGERRWRAAQLAGFERVPAIVRATDDDRMLLDALLENLHRAALNPLEEAAAYEQLIQEFACTHEALATRIGRSRSQVSNTLRLLKLPPTVQRKLAAGVLSAGHARALLAIESAADQEHVAGRIIAEGLSVRAVEELVALRDTARPAERRPRTARRGAAGLEELASSLADRWETRVRVQLGQKRGRLVVDFASVEDLERILGLMAPGATGPDAQRG